MPEEKKDVAPCQDRTDGLQLALAFLDYETDALPTELKGRTDVMADFFF
jgi:hypothetical protein